MIYSDEDKIVDGKLAAPMLKPDWSPEFFRTQNYLGHFVVMRRDLAARRISQRVRWRTGLRFVPARFRKDGPNPAHPARALPLASHEQNPRRIISGANRVRSKRHSVEFKSIGSAAGKCAGNDRLGDASFRVRREFLLRKSLSLSKGRGSRCRVGFGQKQIFRILKSSPNPKEATGEYVLFLDPDLEPLDENWLSAMGEQLSNPRIGAVGARIISSDDAIESAGLILSPNGSVGSAFAGYPRNFRGANRQLQAVRNYSAVSASCFLTRREVFEKIASGPPWDPSTLLGMTGYMAVGVLFESPRARIANGFDSLCGGTAHFEQGKMGARMCLDLQKRWPEMFRRDPCYNPNLSSERADFSLG